MRKAVFVDIDGVISPVHDHTAWGDDLVAGNVFGPVYVSPTLCARLDGLATVPHLSCWSLTSWTAEMRASMHPFPGRDWPVLAEQPEASRGRRWWKLVAVEHWLSEHQEVRAVAWCDDALTSGPTRGDPTPAPRPQGRASSDRTRNVRGTAPQRHRTATGMGHVMPHGNIGLPRFPRPFLIC